MLSLLKEFSYALSLTFPFSNKLCALWCAETRREGGGGIAVHLKRYGIVWNPVRNNLITKLLQIILSIVNLSGTL